jgi:ubiquinone/menaquinone biosynthesis C-methylase UbiE
MARVDYDRQADRYDRGRSLPQEALDTLMVTARRHAGPDVDTVLDLGCGTGRFTASLADTFEDATVIGIEPSAGMLAQAQTKPHPRVRRLRGRSEHVALRDDIVDLAWLFNVVHHFDDLDEAAREVRRVTRGTVIVGGAFGHRDVPSLFRFFPASRAVVDSWPTIAEVTDAFQRAGFTTFLNEQVEQLIAHDLADMVPRIAQRADTALELISDEDFERGLRQLEEVARVEHGPVLNALDLLVIR